MSSSKVVLWFLWLGPFFYGKLNLLSWRHFTILTSIKRPLALLVIFYAASTSNFPSRNLMPHELLSWLNLHFIFGLSGFENSKYYLRQESNLSSFQVPVPSNNRAGFGQEFYGIVTHFIQNGAFFMPEWKESKAPVLNERPGAEYIFRFEENDSGVGNIVW
jgi:hypothetical protein